MGVRHKQVQLSDCSYVNSLWYIQSAFASVLLGSQGCVATRNWSHKMQARLSHVFSRVASCPVLNSPHQYFEAWAGCRSAPGRSFGYQIVINTFQCSFVILYMMSMVWWIQTQRRPHCSQWPIIRMPDFSDMPDISDILTALPQAPLNQSVLGSN